MARGDRPIELTAREFALLEFLMRHAGEAVSKPEILHGVWDTMYEGDPNVVEVFIGYLRRKIDTRATFIPGVRAPAEKQGRPRNRLHERPSACEGDPTHFDGRRRRPPQWRCGARHPPICQRSSRSPRGEGVTAN